MLTALAAHLALGLLSGFVAGLLGVGGGLIMVPVLSWIYARQDFVAQYNIHMALGTSLGVIVFTSLSSLRAHHSYGAVRWDVVRRITPGIVMGTLAGSIMAAWLPDGGLKWLFTAFLFFAASQMLFNLRPRPHRQLPGCGGLTAAGGVIGLVSSWVGIGGGTLSVPFLSWCTVRFQEAIGTSAAIGLPIAVSGALGYAVTGRSVQGLPGGSLGFVYLPALAAIAALSVISAPCGARLTHRLPVARLKKIFAVLLLIIAARMAYGLLTGAS